MIRVNFRFGNSLVTGFEISGHSGYADEGSDIICSAVSSAAIMTANTITEVMGANAEVSENDGYLLLKLEKSDAEKSQDILNGLLLHLKGIEQQYPEFIKIERGA